MKTKKLRPTAKVINILNDYIDHYQHLIDLPTQSFEGKGTFSELKRLVIHIKNDILYTATSYETEL